MDALAQYSDSSGNSDDDDVAESLPPPDTSTVKSVRQKLMQISSTPAVVEKEIVSFMQFLTFY